MKTFETFKKNVGVQCNNNSAAEPHKWIWCIWLLLFHRSLGLRFDNKMYDCQLFGLVLVTDISICFCVCVVERTRLDFLFMFDIKYISTENLNSGFFTFYFFMLFLFLRLFSLSPPFVLLLIKVLVNSMLRLFFWSQLWWAISFVNVGDESYYRTDFTYCFFCCFLLYDLDSFSFKWS